MVQAHANLKVSTLSSFYIKINILPISMLGTNKFLITNNSNIEVSLLRITNYIRNIKIIDNNVNNLAISGFGHAAWIFIFSIYEGE